MARRFLARCSLVGVLAVVVACATTPASPAATSVPAATSPPTAAPPTPAPSPTPAASPTPVVVPTSVAPTETSPPATPVPTSAPTDTAVPSATTSIPPSPNPIPATATAVPPTPTRAPPPAAAPLSPDQVAATAIAASVGEQCVASPPKPAKGWVGDPTRGKALFQSRGCSACHGDLAQGAVGPRLAGTTLSFEAVLHQLRQPRGVMQRYLPADQSDADECDVYIYVKGLKP